MWLRHCRALMIACSIHNCIIKYALSITFEFQSAMVLLSILLWGLLLALTVFLIMKYLSKNRDFWFKRGIPTLYSSQGLFEKVTLMEKEARLYRQVTTFGGIIEFSQPFLYVRDMDLVRDVYVKDFDYFVNRRPFLDNDYELWNQMLMNKVDREWRDLRNTMSPTFSTGKIRNMFPIMYESSKKLVSYLDALAEKSDGLMDFEEVLGRYAIDVIISSAAGLESEVFSGQNSIVAKMGRKLLLKFTPLVMFKITLASMSPMLAKLLNFKMIDPEGREFFKKVIRDAIKHREMTGERRNDFLQLMIDAKNGNLKNENDSTEEMDTYDKDAQLNDNSKAKITEQAIVANCVLFFMAGFDTVQGILAFGAYALALNQEVQGTLRRKLQDATEKTDGVLTYDIINESEYLDQFVNETLRMYPPSLRQERCCSKDYTLPNGSVLPKGAYVEIPLYQIHHDEKHFQSPSVFDPLRFSKEAKAQRHPYAFMPFGHGPRNCIAKRFAMTEIKVVLADLVLKFEVEPCAKTTIPMVYADAFTVKPAKGMWLKIKKRINNL